MWQKPDDNPGSYFNLRAKLLAKMKHDGLVKEKIQTTLIQAYEQALSDSRVVLSRPERTRLFRHLLEDILTEIINENKAENG